MTDIFDTGEGRDDQRQRRGHLALLAAFLPAGFHRHRVFTDRNGQAQRRAQLFAHRFHRLIQASVFTRVAGGGHPVSRQLHAVQLANLRGGDVGQRFADRQTARGREVQQGDRGALAHRHRFAIVAVEAGGGHRAVGHRDLPRANHLVAGDHTGHGAVADGDEERSWNLPPRPPSLTSSGIALERPPAPTSWIKRIGLASPNCQQRSITS